MEYSFTFLFLNGSFVETFVSPQDETGNEAHLGEIPISPKTSIVAKGLLQRPQI
jgi:hypothetical protein